MRILAIETATEACSAALITNNSDETIISRFQLAPREHTKLILPMMDEVLQEANIELNDIDAIAFSRGPGAFTGLRIAAGVAQGAALSVNKQVIPVSTLAALALQAVSQNIKVKIIIVALDARMGEVYWGVYRVQTGNVVLVGEEKVSNPEVMLETMLSYSNKGVLVTGIGWDAYDEILFSKELPSTVCFIANQYPHASSVARLALTMWKVNKAVLPENAQPVYIRNKVAKKSTKRNA